MSGSCTVDHSGKSMFCFFAVLVLYFLTPGSLLVLSSERYSPLFSFSPAMCVFFLNLVLKKKKTKHKTLSKQNVHKPSRSMVSVCWYCHKSGISGASFLSHFSPAVIIHLVFCLVFTLQASWERSFNCSVFVQHTKSFPVVETDMSVMQSGFRNEAMWCFAPNCNFADSSFLSSCFYPGADSDDLISPLLLLSNTLQWKACSVLVQASLPGGKF